MNFRELLLGPAYFYHKRLIQKSYLWNELDIQKYLDANKQRYAKSPNIKTKNEYIKNLNLYENKYYNFLTKKVSTGGTSGKSLEFHRDIIISRQKERAYIFDIWKEAGYKPFDLRVMFRGDLKDKIIHYSYLHNCYIISPNELIEKNKEKIKKFLLELPSFFLDLFPSFLFTLINYLGEENFVKLNIRGVLAGSEVFPGVQLDHLRDNYNFPIAHWYGHSEYAVLSKYCQHCTGFHFYPTYGLCEFVHTHDNYYSIIATSYNRIGTKFIRYNTGDIAEINKLCCGYCSFPRVQKIIGRDQDFFYDAKGIKHSFGPYLFGMRKNLWNNIKAIQFIQTEKGSLDVQIIIKDDDLRDLVEKTVRKRFSELNLNFSYVTELGKTKIGKHRYFISHLN